MLCLVPTGVLFHDVVVQDVDELAELLSYLNELRMLCLIPMAVLFMMLWSRMWMNSLNSIIPE
jgi:hypothetical protein